MVLNKELEQYKEDLVEHIKILIDVKKRRLEITIKALNDCLSENNFSSAANHSNESNNIAGKIEVLEDLVKDIEVGFI